MEPYLPTSDWDPCMGKIDRSLKYDYRNIAWRRKNRYSSINISFTDDIIENKLSPGDLMTSTIIDAYKTS